MRRIMLAIALLAFAAPAAAQVNITVAFTAEQSAVITRAVADANAATCNALFISGDSDLATCLAAGAGAQAFARNKYCSRLDGTSHPCGTGAGASSNVRIYRSVTELVQKLNDEIEAAARAKQKVADSLCARWPSMSAAQRNVRCAADGQPNGCDLCP